MCDLSFQPNNKTYGAILLCQFLFLSIFRIIIEKKRQLCYLSELGILFRRRIFPVNQIALVLKRRPIRLNSTQLQGRSTHPWRPLVLAKNLLNTNTDAFTASLLVDSWSRTEHRDGHTAPMRNTDLERDGRITTISYSPTFIIRYDTCCQKRCLSFHAVSEEIH